MRTNNFLLSRVCRVVMKHIASRRLPLLAAFLLLVAPLVAQQSQTPYEIAGKSMNYLPASVEAASLFRRTPEEVDYVRGRVTIRIPLYTIKTSSFTLPISISYTTGGIRAEQKSGRIGLGWQLEAEPMISREVRGLRDEESYLTDSSYYASNMQQYEALVGAGTKDLLPDFFHYRTLGGSGKFILGMTDNYRFHPILLNRDYAELSTPNNKVGPWFDNEIRLTDENGYVYRFGATGNSRETTRMGNGIRTTTAWKISEIHGLDGLFLGFQYKEYPNGERTRSNYDYYAFEDMDDSSVSADAVVPPYPGYWKGVDGYENYFHYEKDEQGPNGSTVPVFKKWAYNDTPPGKVYAPLDVYVDLRLIERITFPNGSVHFTYSDSDKTLQTIEVRDAQGNAVKKIRFTRHSEGFDRYLLDAVEIQDGVGGTVEKYRFDYYGLPADVQPFSPYTKAVDYWGYFNGHTENTDLVPRQTIEFRLWNNATKRTVTIGGGICKDPSFEHARAYSLASVFYPTGGQTTFQYEPNKIQRYPYGNYTAGGLRIARIEDFDSGQKLTNVRSFTYSTKSGLEGIGSMRYPLADWNFVQKMKKHYLKTIDGYSFLSFSRDYRMYSHTSKVHADNDVYYEVITETTGDGVVKHVFDNYQFWTSPFYEPGEHETHFDEPLYKSEELATGGFHAYYRSDTLARKTSEGRWVRSYDNLIDLEKTSIVANFTGMMPGDANINEYYRGTFRKKPLPALIVSTKYGGNSTTTYNPEGAVSEGVSYSLNSYNLVAEKRTSSADGKVYKTKYLYPFDYTGEPYRTMVGKSDIGTPVEERYYENDLLKKIVKRVYQPASLSLNGYNLTELQETTDAACSLFENVESYDKFLYNGVPIQLTRRDGTVVSLLWAYEYQHLAAIVENATVEEIEGILGTSFFPGMAQSTVCPESNYVQMESLQQSLPEAKVTVFRYKPLVGITQITAPDGRKTYYEYDAAGRLQKEKDLDSQILNTYEYYEKNK